MDPRRLLADRTRSIEVSGIRKVFDLGKSLKDPINLSIGQPHFDVPEAIKGAAKDAIDRGQNGYTVTQGLAEFRERIKADLKPLGHADREVIITSGTSGGLLLAMMAVVNPGDEVIVPDPYFVAYPHLVTLAGGTSVYVGTYPNFQIDPAKIEAAITPRTKVILLCSPSNPTGATVPVAVQKQLAEIAARHNVLLLSDEIYKAFHYDTTPRSPAEFDSNVLVIEGFGKTYGMTGWRLGYAHGPKAIIDEMMKLQQFTFVCAPSVVQYAGLAAMDFDVSGIVADYKRKRDRLCAGLRDRFEFDVPGGAFYLFAKTPWGTGTEFVTEAVKNSLLVIPGGVFSRKDTHFRISYAAKDETLDRGIEVLNRLSKG
ncbi:pyridoxal phosphate-dependent aminotransferase [Limnoglobus roseus]|uniref:Aminotransferase n=1 Tax=Limnoglobus roseus TaxID=2598579 RepID=A0A5C1ASH9_9BACT|nr:aminotransferase class I/II-fold pyridoxal phosphate-dependent enzyme [Limnoglobus roseus]QEL20194.1 aminotransferase class V-fold PLP-dependent enzyme [Limnoglobus roseus]